MNSSESNFLKILALSRTLGGPGSKRHPIVTVTLSKSGMPLAPLPPHWGEGRMRLAFPGGWTARLPMLGAPVRGKAGGATCSLVQPSESTGKKKNHRLRWTGMYNNLT